MEEDDDAFLYGDDDEAQAGAGQAAAVQAAGGVTEAAGKPAVGEGVETKVAEETKDNQEGKDDNDEEEADDDEEEEEEEDSDSDLEIIVDGSAGPPAGYNARQPIQPIRPVPAQRAPPSVITSDYTPNARPGQAPSASSLEALTGLTGTAGDQAAPGKAAQTIHTNSSDFMSMSDLPEGPPPPVPMTAPRLDLDPSDQALMLPPETVEDEPGPLIYHIDPTEFEEKPWRRPGADLTDWFNYGFNEHSWKLWGEKKHGRTMERIDMETNGGRRDHTNEGHEEEHDQYNDNRQSNFALQMPQQLQAMQAMMGASGPPMTPEQMMAFMGMGPGGMPGMGMMGMPGMAAMFGQQNNNVGMFPNGFNGMPNMQMMQQQQPPFDHSQIGDGSLMRFAGNKIESGSMKPEEGNRDDFNEDPDHVTNGDRSYTPEQIADQVEGQEQPITMEKVASAAGSEKAHDAAHAAPTASDMASLPKGPSTAGARGGMSIRGAGATGTATETPPTGPSARAVSIPKGLSAERGGGGGGHGANNIPTGPKNPGRRYNDRDSGAGQADALDYGASMGGHHREESAGQQRGGRDAARRRQRSTESRDVSTDRDREREYEYRRDQDRDQSGNGAGDHRDDRAASSRRSNRERGSERKRYSSQEEETGAGSRRDRRGDGDRKTSNTSQRHSTRRGEYRDERRGSETFERDDEWERESIESSASRRRTSTRNSQQQSGRSAARSERRRGGGDEADSGSDTERERKHGRSQMRSERRAGRENQQEKAASAASTSTRKRGAPEDDLSPVRSTTSRKRR